MKKVSGLLLSTILLCSSASAVGAEGYPSSISVYIDGELQQYEQAPVVERDFTLVPLRGIFEELGATVEWDGQAKKITATKDNTRIVLTVGSDQALKNGMPVTLDVPAKLINGRTMVPLRFISESLGSTVKWDGNNKRIDITVKGENLQTSNGTSDGIGQRLTFVEAVALAEKSSYALKNAEADIERSEKVRDEATDNLDYAPIGFGNGQSDAQGNSALKGAEQAEVALKSAEKNLNVVKDSISYKVRKAYEEVLQKQKEVELAELTLSNSLIQEKITNVKLENGLASEFDQVKAQSTVQESKQKKEASLKALDDAYQKFNQLLGIEVKKKYELVDSATYTELDDVNLDEHVRNVMEENPSLWALEQQIDLAKLDVTLYTFNVDGSTPYEAEEIDVAKAKYKLSETKQKLDESIRTMYFNIRQLENQLGVMQASLAKAEQSVKLVQAKYEVGMAIELELAEAALGVEQLKKQIFDVTVQHEQLKLAFEKPWVLTGN